MDRPRPSVAERILDQGRDAGQVGVPLAKPLGCDFDRASIRTVMPKPGVRPGALLLHLDVMIATTGAAAD